MNNILRLPDGKPYKGECSINGCDSPAHIRGWCRNHYQRWQRHGNPLGGKIPGETYRWLLDHKNYTGDDCLEWPFARLTNGYGSLRFNKKHYVASRLMCEIVNGPPPSPHLDAAHSCGNGHLGCVNPNHLSWKTRAENAADMLIHGTDVRGEKHPQSKISDAQFMEIYKRAWAGENQREIAEDYGISSGHVSTIKCGLTRPHLFIKEDDMPNLSIPDILFLSIQTSGFYIEREPIDSPMQPWAVQIAAALCTQSGEFTNCFSSIIKPDGRMIKEGAFNLHGISTRDAAQVGVPEPRVLGLLSDMLKTTPTETHMKVVTFANFDSRIISSLFARFAVSQGKPSSAYDRLWRKRPLVEFISLIDPWCTQLCKIKSDDDGSFKWPSIDEVREIMLNKPPREGKRDACSDMVDIRDIYFHCKERGLFEQDKAA